MDTIKMLELITDVTKAGQDHDMQIIELIRLVSDTVSVLSQRVDLLQARVDRLVQLELK